MSISTPYRTTRHTTSRMRPSRFPLAIAAITLAVLSALLFPHPAHAARGRVVLVVSSCDYYLVEYAGGYALLEWYGGCTPEEGDILAGAFDRYGMKTIFDITKNRETRVWVEDYALSRDSALEQLYDHCE